MIRYGIGAGVGAGVRPGIGGGRRGLPFLGIDTEDRFVSADSIVSVSGFATGADRVSVALLNGAMAHDLVIANGATGEAIFEVAPNAEGYKLSVEMIGETSNDTWTSGVTFNCATATTSGGTYTEQDSASTFADTTIDSESITASWVRPRGHVIDTGPITTNVFIRVRIVNASGNTKNMQALGLFDGRAPVILWTGASIMASCGSMRQFCEISRSRYGWTPLLCNRAVGGRGIQAIAAGAVLSLTERTYDHGQVHAGGAQVSYRPFPLTVGEIADIETGIAAMKTAFDNAGVPFVQNQITFRDYLTAPLVNDGANPENGSLPFNEAYFNAAANASYPGISNVSRWPLYQWTLDNRAALLDVAGGGDGVHPEDPGLLLRWFIDRFGEVCGLSRSAANFQEFFNVGFDTPPAGYATISNHLADGAGTSVMLGDTGIMMSIVVSFLGSSAFGGRSDAVDFPSNASLGYFSAQSTTGTMRFYGLDPDWTPEFAMLASRDAAGTRTTLFGVNGVTDTVNAAGNQITTLIDASPTSDGAADLTCDDTAPSDPGLNFGYLNCGWLKVPA